MSKKLDTTFSTRQYMLSQDFELYYYRDMNLTRVEPHSHEHYEFYFFLEGDNTIYIRDIPHKLSAGTLIFIPAGCPHYMTRGNQNIPYRRFVLWISQEYFQSLSEESSCYTYLIDEAQKTNSYCFHFDTIEFNSMQHKLFRLIEETVSDRFGKFPKITLQLNDLLLYLSRSYYEQNHKINPKETQTAFEAMMQIIEENLDGDLSLDILAKRLFLNKYYISHLFKNRLGLSVHQYITKRRLAICRDAYLSNDSVAEISRRYGFSDYSSFYRAFKKEYGISPKEYKTIYKNLPLNSG